MDLFVFAFLSGVGAAAVVAAVFLSIWLGLGGRQPSAAASTASEPAPAPPTPAKAPAPAAVEPAAASQAVESAAELAAVTTPPDDGKRGPGASVEVRRRHTPPEEEPREESVPSEAEVPRDRGDLNLADPTPEPVPGTPEASPRTSSPEIDDATPGAEAADDGSAVSEAETTPVAVAASALPAAAADEPASPAPQLADPGSSDCPSQHPAPAMPHDDQGLEQSREVASAAAHAALSGPASPAAGEQEAYPALTEHELSLWTTLPALHAEPAPAISAATLPTLFAEPEQAASTEPPAEPEPLAREQGIVRWVNGSAHGHILRNLRSMAHRSAGPRPPGKAGAIFFTGSDVQHNIQLQRFDVVEYSVRPGRKGAKGNRAKPRALDIRLLERGGAPIGAGMSPESGDLPWQRPRSGSHRRNSLPSVGFDTSAQLQHRRWGGDEPAPELIDAVTSLGDAALSPHGQPAPGSHGRARIGALPLLQAQAIARAAAAATASSHRDGRFARPSRSPTTSPVQESTSLGARGHAGPRGTPGDAAREHPAPALALGDPASSAAPLGADGPLAAPRQRTSSWWRRNSFPDLVLAAMAADALLPDVAANRALREDGYGYSYAGDFVGASGMEPQTGPGAATAAFGTLRHRVMASAAGLGAPALVSESPVPTPRRSRVGSSVTSRGGAAGGAGGGMQSSGGSAAALSALHETPDGAADGAGWASGDVDDGSAGGHGAPSWRREGASMTASAQERMWRDSYNSKNPTAAGRGPPADARAAPAREGGAHGRPGVYVPPGARDPRPAPIATPPRSATPVSAMLDGGLFTPEPQVPSARYARS